MSTFILVPGAWLGAWVWQDVAAGLRDRGHQVHPMSLTGLADRRHLAGTWVNADTHITDIVNLVEYEDLTDAILVGHSYAGAVPVPGAAHRIGDRLSHVVFLDSAPLDAGRSMTDLMEPEMVDDLLAAAADSPGGWQYAFPDRLSRQADTTGLTPSITQRMRDKATPQPIGTYTQPLSLPGAPIGDPRRVLIACADFQKLLDTDNPALSAVTGPNLRRYDLDTGHWAMLSEPRLLTDVLARIPDRVRSGIRVGARPGDRG